ncbi:hypothetical protein Zm00014a_018059 [Zea mays]|uniref:Uncharacterized protein n=1 Tax=Zea mays TaxID=4577 RepID=A0A3L6FNS1_MAIZE|nr:hypothetical protein Zm00014a_018059 [Zea mays]
MIGVAAIFWLLWLCRNDVVFNNKQIPSIMLIILWRTYCFRFWRLVQKKSFIRESAMFVALLRRWLWRFFVRHGWQFNGRIAMF